MAIPAIVERLFTLHAAKDTNSTAIIFSQDPPLAVSVNTLAVTIPDRIVEDTNPPINTSAKGDISGLLLSKIGVNPPIAVKLVSTMSRNRSSPASFIASSRLFPSARN